MSTMAEASTAGKKKKRVERRGRFTITEIEPDSPAAGLEEPSMFSADGDVYDDNDSGGEEDTNRQSFVRDTAAAAALMATERISPFGSAVFERSNGAVRVVDTDGVSVDGNSTHGGTIVTETAVASTYDDGQPRGQSQSDLRVQRKGRFTIIELSSDTPPSSQAPAEEFSTTTSISITSTQVSQANAQNLSSSPTAVSAVMNAPPTPLSRAVSESVVQTTRRPSRSFVHSSDGLELSHSHDTPRARSGSPTHPIQDTTSLPSLSSSFGNAPFRTQPHEPPSTSPQLKPMKSPAGNGVALTAALNGSALAVANSGEKRQPTQELGANRRHLASRQKAITISAEQFIQQQQTIASLIRQQQELKQLISVLQEQQQHLMSVPMHLPEFTLDQAHTEAQKDSMREVQIQVTTLSRANDALQNLLSQAEQDAHERTMEIECLSDENDELRHRQLILERKYYEERKRSLTLEQELQRTKRSLHAARQKGSEQHQQQQFLRKYQHKLLSQPQDLDDPILDHRLASTHAAA